MPVCVREERERDARVSPPLFERSASLLFPTTPDAQAAAVAERLTAALASLRAVTPALERSEAAVQVLHDEQRADADADRAADAVRADARADAAWTPARVAIIASVRAEQRQVRAALEQTSDDAHDREALAVRARDRFFSRLFPSLLISLFLREFLVCYTSERRERAARSTVETPH